MPILVKESPEPFTFGSENSAPILAECEAYRSLLASIARYGRREIMGRSVLISGHRGSGKTTLVRWAVQQAQSQLRNEANAARPLLVPLHGPDLLGGESVLATDQEIAGKAEQLGKHRRHKSRARLAVRKDMDNDSDTRAALRMLTEALHRAYIAELGRAFVAQVAGDAALHELAAQLVVELDHAPELDTLRFMWERAGKLQTGVLFEGAGRDLQQGYRELLAASAVIEAYRRVAGKLEGVEGSSRQAEYSEAAEAKSNWSGKDFLNPLIGLVGGAAAAAGILTGGSGGALRPLAAALAAILTAVGGTAALNYSSTRSRRNSRESKLTFTWDTSIASLDRMLPVMVERIVQAGLAPIFVVDELDKIPDLEEKMEHLIRHLKHLVTEKTFFCFLTDRSYFEHVVANARTKVYGKEHTFFSDRLFVHYSPEDMHKYLFATLSRENLTDNEMLDRLVLPSLLLERSKMHPIDLRRALADLTDEKSAITLPIGTVRQPEGYGMAVLVQAAFETVLDQPDLRSRLSQDPNFARVVYDALYLPARSWENGDDTLKLDRETLRTTLEARMRDEDHAQGTSNTLTGADLDLVYASARRLAAFLRQPQTLVQELQTPGAAPGEVPQKYGPEYAAYKERQRDAIREVVPVKDVLLGEEDGAEVSRWLRDPFGRPRPESRPAEEKRAAAAAVSLWDDLTQTQKIERVVGVLPFQPDAVVTPQPVAEPPAPRQQSAAPPSQPTSDRIAQIRELNTFLRSISGQRLDLDKLATRIHLLGISPAWPSVENAIRAFENAGSPVATTDPALQSNQALIESYARMFDAMYGPLRRALVIATLMAIDMPGTNFPRLLEKALVMLAAELRFAKLDIQEIARRLQEFDTQIKMMTELMKAPVDEALAPAEWDRRLWGEKLREWMNRTFDLRPPSLLSVADHQKHWRVFLVRHLQGASPIFYPALTDLMLKARGGALPFPPDWTEVTCLDCAKALRLLNATPVEEPLLVETILVELGFAPQVSTMIPDVNASAEALELLETCLSPAVQRKGERVLLVIGGAEEKRAVSKDGDAIIRVDEAAGSIAAGWRLAADCAVIPVLPEQFASATGLVNDILQKLQYQLVLFEPPLLPPLPSLDVGVFIFRIAGEGAPDDPGMIVAPPSLDAAVAESRKKARVPPVVVPR